MAFLKKFSRISSRRAPEGIRSMSEHALDGYKELID